MIVVVRIGTRWIDTHGVLVREPFPMTIREAVETLLRFGHEGAVVMAPEAAAAPKRRTALHLIFAEVDPGPAAPTAVGG